MSASVVHVPVLLREVLEHLPVPPGGRVLDLTLGLGGHAQAILAQADADVRYLGVDRDPQARAMAKGRLGSDARITIMAGSYEEVWEDPAFEAWRHLQAPQGFDVVLMDLGISTLHLKDSSRGFSFMEEGPLDMRMDTERGLTAREWIQEQSEEELADAIYRFGEERASRPIARSILKALAAGELNTTSDLAAAVYRVIPREPAKRKGLSDPATRTFQAIRIAVNGELERLGAAIEKAASALKVEGRIGVISFHSLEDRIVKQTLRRLAGIHDGPGRVPPSPLPKTLRLIYGGGIAPTEDEIRSNPPSRSARLRIGERLPLEAPRVP